MAGVYEKVLCTEQAREHDLHWQFIKTLCHCGSCDGYSSCQNTSAFSILPQGGADAPHPKGAGGKVTFLLKENVTGGFCHSAVRVNYF